MAELTVATDGRARLRLRIAVRIGILYLAARVVTTAFLLAAAAMSGPESRFGADATIGDFVTAWDGQWYWLVAENHYPAELPLSASGQIAQNQWAFMPIYAYLSAAVGSLFGAWGAGAFIVTLAAGYGACLVLYRILRSRVDDVTATWAVVFFAASPLAALFQVSYAESLFLLFLFLALWCVMRRRFVWVYPLIVLMGYTRPGVLAFALFLALYGLMRWFTRTRDPLPGRDVAHIVGLGLLATVVGFSWQVIAAVVTGDPDAYLQTELAWRRHWLDDSIAQFIPFEGFVQGAVFWFESWGLGLIVACVALVVTIVGVAMVLLFAPGVKRLGVEIRLWSASYIVYLLAVFFPQSSIFRLLVPLSPLWGAVAMPRSVWWRCGVLAGCLLGQWWWIYNVYAVGAHYWQIP